MKTAVAIALVNGQKVLLQLRDNKPSITMPGMWCLPGGRIKTDENPKQAAIRELLEETGYKLKNPKYFAKDSYFVDNDEAEGYIFFERYDNKQEIKCFEGQKMEFKSLEEIKKLKIVPKHDTFALEAIKLSKN